MHQLGIGSAHSNRATPNVHRAGIWPFDSYGVKLVYTSWDYGPFGPMELCNASEHPELSLQLARKSSQTPESKIISLWNHVAILPFPSSVILNVQSFVLTWFYFDSGPFSEDEFICIHIVCSLLKNRSLEELRRHAKTED